MHNDLFRLSEYKKIVILYVWLGLAQFKNDWHGFHLLNVFEADLEFKELIILSISYQIIWGTELEMHHKKPYQNICYRKKIQWYGLFLTQFLKLLQQYFQQGNWTSKSPLISSGQQIDKHKCKTKRVEKCEACWLFNSK